MGPRTRPRHYFASGNDWGSIVYSLVPSKVTYIGDIDLVAKGGFMGGHLFVLE